MNKKDILLRIGQYLQHSKWCILYAEPDKPYQITSDVDVILSCQAQIDLMAFVKSGQVKLVQTLQHEASCVYYVFAFENENRWDFLAFDTATDYRRNGRIIYKADDVLKNLRKSSDGLPIASPGIAFGYYLVKKMAKAHLSYEQASSLSNLWNKEPDVCRQEMTRFFPLTYVTLLEHAAQSKNWKEVQERLTELRRAMLVQIAKKQPLQTVIYWQGEVPRIVRRILWPTGLWIVFMGIDGSGKSSVLEKVLKDLAPIGRNIARYHFRPGLGQSSPGQINTNPHKQTHRSVLASSIKLIYYLFDYILGYILRIFPQLVRSTFIAFDRHYIDLLVDPKRYRYGGPTWLAIMIGKLIPQPDLFIYLDLPAETAIARKPEITLEDARLLRNKYIQLAQTQKDKAIIIDASQSFEIVSKQVENTIIAFMERRLHK